MIPKKAQHEDVSVRACQLLQMIMEKEQPTVVQHPEDMACLGDSSSSSSSSSDDDVLLLGLPRNNRKAVMFRNVEVIEIPMMKGDHPSCRSGQPIQLSWEVLDRFVLDIDTYEMQKQTRKQKQQNYKNNGSSSSSTRKNCYLSVSTRRRIVRRYKLYSPPSAEEKVSFKNKRGSISLSSLPPLPLTPTSPTTTTTTTTTTRIPRKKLLSKTTNDHPSVAEILERTERLLSVAGQRVDDLVTRMEALDSKFRLRRSLSVSSMEEQPELKVQ